MIRTSILKTSLVAFGMLTMAYTAHTFSSGAPDKKTGSPSSNGVDCATSCHTGGTPSDQEITITTDIPSNGFLENTDYNITITLDRGTSSSSVAGFQTSVEDSSGAHQGMQIVTNSAETKLVGSGNNYLTHKSPKSLSSGQTTWSFKWNSGMANDETVIHVVGNFANNNGSNSGDVVIQKKMALLKSTIGLDEELNASIAVYPNPASEFINVSLNTTTEEKITIDLFDLSGRKVSELFSGKTSLNFNQRLSIPSVEKGTYLLMINVNGKIKHQKIMIV